MVHGLLLHQSGGDYLPVPPRIFRAEEPSSPHTCSPSKQYVKIPSTVHRGNRVRTVKLLPIKCLFLACYLFIIQLSGSNESALCQQHQYIEMKALKGGAGWLRGGNAIRTRRPQFKAGRQRGGGSHSHTHTHALMRATRSK